MAKRFTDTEKWSNPWFRGLPNSYRWLWLYILDNCNVAGIWRCDFELASFHIGAKVNEQDAERYLTQRFCKIDHDKWFVPKFIAYQYKELNPSSPPHRKVLDILQVHGITQEMVIESYPKPTLALEYRKGSLTLQDKEEDKEYCIKEDIQGVTKIVTEVSMKDLEEAYAIYPRKVGKSEGLRRLKVQIKTIGELDDLKKAIAHYHGHLKRNGTESQYIKHFSSFVSSWRDWLDPDAGKAEEIKKERDYSFLKEG